MAGLVSVIFCALLERGAAFVGEFQRAEFFGGLPQQAEPDQFAPDGRPFGTAVFLADAVGGELCRDPSLRIFSVSAPVSTSMT